MRGLKAAPSAPDAFKNRHSILFHASFPFISENKKIVNKKCD